MTILNFVAKISSNGLEVPMAWKSGKLTDTVEREIEERLYPHSRDRLF
jgi:hypothetical protein